MKKMKLLALLAVVTLLTVPARAAGNCGPVRNGAGCAVTVNGGQWRIACPDSGARNRWTFAFPDFYFPGNSIPDTGKPDTTAPDAGKPDSTAPDAGKPDSTAPGTGKPNTAAPADSGLSAYESEVVRLVNAERARYGLAALAADGELSRGARAKSRDMHDKGYFAHESPTYGTPFQMMKSFGISYRAAGENIAYGYSTPEKVVNAWMNSEGHRANILNGSYTRLGVGYVADGHYWTQWFVG